ncbi:MAG: shikimate kinase, partial [Planctomycetota bacterium]|nr:shikimate kinase [Planctomycetota bacterium]
MNLVLIGYRCAGKSTVGRELARRLAMDFVDTDKLIEARHGLGVADIWRRLGESVFRELESDMITEVSRMDNTVISAGGGAVVRYKNLRNLRRTGRLVWLQADVDSILERLEHDAETVMRRPRFANCTLRAEVEQMLACRRSYYRCAADMLVDTSGRTPASVLGDLLGL